MKTTTKVVCYPGLKQNTGFDNRYISMRSPVIEGIIQVYEYKVIFLINLNTTVMKPLGN